LSLSKLDIYLLQTTKAFLYLFAAAMPFSIAITQISLGIATLCWLGRIFITKSVRLKYTSLEWAFAAYIAAELLSLVFSINVPQSIIYLKRILLIAAVYLVAFNVDSDKLFKRMILIFVASITLYSIWGVLSWVNNPQLRVRHLQNSMTAGGITMIGAVACVVLLTKLGSTKWKYLCAAAALVNSVCLILTNTRGSWLGFIIGVLFAFFYTNKKLLILVPVLAAAFYFLSPPAFKYHAQGFFDPNMPTISKRLIWWRAAWEIFKDHPITGIGDVGTSEIFRQYAPPEYKGSVGHFHSNYLHILATLGVIGFTAFMFMIVRIFIEFLRILRSSLLSHQKAWALSVLSIFLAFNINGFFEWNFGDAEIITMVWFVTGLALALPVSLRPVSIEEKPA
jgi:O-antigen ligase